MIITDYFEDNGQTDDRLDLEWFESDVTEYQVGSKKLFPVPTNASTLRTQINGNPGSNGCTAMGGELQAAFNTLVDNGVHDRFAILLTDGLQNVDPKVTKTGGHYEIIEGGGTIMQPDATVMTVASHILLNPLRLGHCSKFCSCYDPQRSPNFNKFQ